MKIIVINGSGGSGKDTFVSCCSSLRRNIFNLSTINVIKEIALDMGWDGQKDDKGRRFLSDLKDAYSRYNNLPFMSVYNDIQNTLYRLHRQGRTEPEPIFFIHCREPKEISIFEHTYDARSIIITRKNTTEYHNHADQEVLEHEYDYQISNNGSKEELVDTAQKFLDKINNENWHSSFHFDYIHLFVKLP